MATIPVTLSGDAANPVNDGEITLREAILYVNGDFVPLNDRTAFDFANLGTNDTIQFDASLNGATITLSHDELLISETVTIDAMMLTNGITIDASGNDLTPTQNNGDGSRVFNIDLGEPPETSSFNEWAVTFRGLTITGGDVIGNGATGSLGGGGGGIRAYFPNVFSGFDDDDDIYLQFDKAGLFIEDSIIRDNYTSTQGGDGGGIYANMGNALGGAHTTTLGLEFQLIRSTVDDNGAANRGGGVFLSGAAGTNLADSPDSKYLIQDSTISGNSAGVESTTSGPFGNSGGGVYAYFFSGDNPIGDTTTVDPTDAYAAFLITGTTIDNNDAREDGGGVLICTKRQDTNPDVETKVEIVNSTISTNTAGSPASPGVPAVVGNGGGLLVAIPDIATEVESVEVQITNSTFYENKATRGGGIFSKVPTASAGSGSEVDMRLANTIISGNWEHDGTTTDNFYGSINAAESQHNLISDNQPLSPSSPDNDFRRHDGTHADIAFDDLGAGNEDNGGTNNPLLKALAFNGGFSRTHELETNSPALDEGSNSLADALEWDQRGEGFPRIFSTSGTPTVDIGAYELSPGRVFDIRLKGSSWTGLDHVSFADRVLGDGDLSFQHRPIFTEGVDTIEVHFSQDVEHEDGTALNGSELKLLGKSGAGVQAEIAFTWDSYNSTTHVATWTLSSALPEDKYALYLNSDPAPGKNLVDVAMGFPLDLDWTNMDAGTPDVYDDDPSQIFVSGNGVEGGEIEGLRFHFAYLPGDYNQNGRVEADEGLVLDGDGNGTPGETADESVGTVGDFISLLSFMGADFEDDEVIDALDQAIWEAGFGDNIVSGDADGDGDVDGADLLIWQREFGAKSAWHMPAAVASAQLLVGSAAPKVDNVTISGSLSTHSPFSMDTVDGSGDQLTTIPVGGADSVSITFSEPVNVTGGDLVVTGLRTGVTPELAEFSYDTTTDTATWRFEGWALGDQYILALSDRVTDVDRNELDGEWTNPASVTTTNSLVSEFPSGDGNPGGMFKFAITLLTGDANLDNVVDDDDYDIFVANFGLSNRLFTQGDFNGDGNVDLSGDGWPLVGMDGTDLTSLAYHADFDGDMDVDMDDMDVIFDHAFQSVSGWSEGDLNDDGYVDEEDLDIALAVYGLEFDTVA